MTLATRIRHQVNMHANFGRDETRIAAHYGVQGKDGVLVVVAWMAHEMAKDANAVAVMLNWMDEEARRAAEHPEGIPTAQLEWT